MTSDRSEDAPAPGRDEVPASAPLVPRDPLSAREWWRAAGFGAAAVALTAAVATPLELAVGGGLPAALFDTVVFGGILAAAVVVVSVERVHARRCDRCGRRPERGAGRCPACGYDLEARPVFVCTAGHRALESGVCDCGRRRQPAPRPPLLHRSVVRTLWFGAAALAFLLAVGALLQLLAP